MPSQLPSNVFPNGSLDGTPKSSCIARRPKYPTMVGVYVSVKFSTLDGNVPLVVGAEVGTAIVMPIRAIKATSVAITSFMSIPHLGGLYNESPLQKGWVKGNPGSVLHVVVS